MEEERDSLLIVDDETGPVESLRMIFKPTHRVFVASNGREALDILRTTSIDVVTLDLRLRGMQGAEVLESMRERGLEVPVIVISAYIPRSTAARLARARVFACVSKPFDVEQVRKLVCEAARSGKRLRESVPAN